MGLGLSLQRYVIHQPIKGVINVPVGITFPLKRVCGIVAVVGGMRGVTQGKDFFFTVQRSFCGIPSGKLSTL